jgi:hypothetical protein
MKRFVLWLLVFGWFLAGCAPDIQARPVVTGSAPINESTVSGFCLFGCAGDPRAVADAEMSKERAGQDAINQEQARAQGQASFEIEKMQAQEQARIDLAQREATSAQWVKSWNTFVMVVMWFVTLAGCTGLVAVAAGFSFAAVGTGRAVAQVAQVKANLIYMDKSTRSYPLFLQHVGQGRFTLADMTTGQVKQLDIREAGDRELIRGVNMARLAGAVAQEARQHKTTPGGVFLAADNALALFAEVQHE